MESIRIPVRLVCFPCGQDRTRPTCYSMQRVCLTCARQYLQLDVPAERRNTSIKCLFCTETCCPRELYAEIAYEKDFFFMSLDSRSDYRCPLRGDCLFVGTHQQLDVHVHTECSYRKIFCVHCMDYFMDCDREHKFACRGLEICRYCHVFFPTTEMEKHLSQIHHFKYCSFCKDVISTEDTCHESSCPYRYVTCLYCQSKMRYVMYPKHRQEEISETKKEMTRLEEHTQRLKDIITIMESKEIMINSLDA